MYVGLHVKYPLFLPDFSETWICSTDFSKNTQVLNLIEIYPVGSEKVDMNTQTDRQTAE